MRGGKREGAGRKPGIKTQARRWEEEHPNAYAELMDTLYARAQGRSSIECPYCHESFRDPVIGDSESARYIIDRIKGKPKATVGIAEEDKDLLTAATVLEFWKMMDAHERKQLTENNLGGKAELWNGTR